MSVASDAESVPWRTVAWTVMMLLTGVVTIVAIMWVEANPPTLEQLNAVMEVTGRLIQAIFLLMAVMSVMGVIFLTGVKR